MVDRDDIPQKVILENADEDRQASSEDAQVRFEEDDFNTETKQKIGEYFRQHVEDFNKESEAVISDSPELDVFSGDDAESTEGYTAKFNAGEAGEARQFFENQSRSTTFDRDILPGKNGDVSSDSEVQASLLLGELRNDPTPIAEEVCRRIQENANFSPNRKYISNPDNPDETSVEEDVAGTRAHLIQPELGSHGPKKLFGEIQVEEGVTPTLTIKQLQNLGCQILLESSGEVFIPSDPSDIAQTLAARASTAAVPGVARLGFRIDSNRFSATEVIRSNVDGEIRKPELQTELASTVKPSYGSFNNQFVPFAAISSGFSSVIVGTLLAVTFSEIFILLAELLKNEMGFKNAVSMLPLGANEQPQITSNESRRRRLGSYIPKEINDEQGGLADLGLALLSLNDADLLVDTQFDYKESLQEGVKVFFGIDNSNFLSSVTGTATKIAESPGYYNGILRNLVRSVLEPLESIAGSVAGLAGGAGPAALTRGPTDVQPLVGPPSDPTNLLGIINVIKESQFLKFMNILAVLGDVSKKTDNNEIQSTIDRIPDTIDNPLKDRIDGDVETILNPAALHKKNRLSDGIEEFRGALAWGSNTARSLFLINRKVIEAERLLGTSGESGGWNQLGSSNRNNKVRGSRRFTPLEVSLMERELDAYYVPFYFHDLRTNEIIAFHAFLETVSDSYDVEYQENDGYGRIGKVHSYKNTNRNIQLSFKVVSTNPNDFSEMWYKINKLVMLLFPQYTLGRPVSFNGQKFIQPFSQIPSASPMIRLRVGDLIKTNFCDLDLTRIFGLGSENFQLSDEAPQEDAQQQARLRAAVRSVEQAHLAYHFERGDQFIWAEAQEQIGSTIPRSTPASFIKRIEDQAGFRARTQRRRQAQRQRRGRTRPPDIPVGARARVEEVLGEREDSQRYIISFVPALTGTDGGTMYEIDFSGQPAGKIRVDPISVANRAAQQTGQTVQTPADTNEVDEESRSQVREFFAATDAETGTITSEGNPVVKSFESTRGQGLPGFIKSLTFNWDGAVWETEGLNNRAPKWCTIDIAFSPVWDINPGLDVNGNMIGAPYNIGSILQQIKQNRARPNEEAISLVNYASQATPPSREPDEDDGGIVGAVGGTIGI